MLIYGDFKGFSLIEVMIVVAIIAILASIAYPSYQGYIRSSHRTDAQSIMGDMQLLQEKYRVNHPTYGALADLGPIPPSEYYTFVVSGTSATAYTITANAKLGTSQANDSGCTTMAIDQGSTKSPPECWKK